MISLLPPIAKKELAAARTNVLLLRYLILVVGVIAFLCIEMVVVFVFLNQQKDTSLATVQENENKSRELAPVKAAATSFNNDLAIAENIMSKQVSYTAILREFANTMPSGVVISDLTIDPTTIGKPISMPLKAKSLQAVFDFKHLFNNSTYFEDVSIQTISDASQDGKNKDAGEYPVSATVNITFKQSLLTVGNAK